MAGQIYNAIQTIIQQKSRGNELIAGSIRTNLILKGINITKYTPTSPDDPAIMQKVREVGSEFGIRI